MEKKKQALAEHNDLITAHYDMSAPEQDIFSLVISQLKKNDPPDQRYNVAIRDIESLTNKRIDYTKVDGYAKKLLSRVCTIIRDNGDPLYTGMISDAEHVRGEGYFKIGISPQLRPYLFDLKANFTKYQLKMFGLLRSKYSKRIYKMLSQFKSSKSKSSGVMWISVEELKMRLKLLDPKTGKETFAKDWTGFVRKVLEVAKAEINEFTDISFEYEAKKTGRKFTHLQFNIVRVAPEQLKHIVENQTTYKEGRLQKQLLSDFGLKDWQVTDIVAYVPEVEIQSTLRDIQIKLSEGQIKNVGGYTARVFDTKYGLGFFLSDNVKNTPNKALGNAVFSEKVRKEMQASISFKKGERGTRTGAGSLAEVVNTNHSYVHQ